MNNHEIIEHCPVCSTELDMRGDIFEDGFTVCKKGHYEYGHSYGSYNEFFDYDGNGFIRLEMLWHYSETDIEKKARERAVSAFLGYLKVLK